LAASTLIRCRRSMSGNGEGELPEVTVPTVADDAARMRQHLANRHGGDRRAVEEVEPLPARVVESQRSLFDELHDRCCREGLGVRRDPEQVARWSDLWMLDVGMAVGGVEHHDTIEQDRRLDARHALQPLLERQPAIEVVGGISDRYR
jgi:hypothetical protein